jgi:hypothetical protein
VQVAHCLFTGDGCWEFWLEDASRLKTLPVQRGRRSGVAEPRPHPFAVPEASLAAALGVAHSVGFEEVGSSVLALPTRGARPCPSPDLASAARLAGSAVPQADHLAAWVVPTVRLDTATASEVLNRFEDSAQVTGATVRYAAALVPLARRIVADGLVVPSMDWDDGDELWYAAWQPMPSLRLAGVRGPLVAAMPPALRCWMFDNEITLAPAGEVFDGALNSFVDMVANRALAGGSWILPPARRGRRPERVPVAEHWLAALTGDTNAMAVDEADDLDAEEFALELERWRSGGKDTGVPAGLVRTCLRLTAPAGVTTVSHPQAAPQDQDGGQSWSVELLLQSVEDPSLVAAAGEVWRHDGNARLFAEAGIDPQAELLAGLGRAAGVFPPLAKALQHAMPVAVPLDGAGALDFLRTKAAELSRAGLGVQLPAWWSGRQRLGLRLAVSTPAQPGIVDKPAAFGMDQLVEYAWQVSLGDDVLTEQELAELANAKEPLVRVRGQWVEVDQVRLAQGLKQLGKARRKPMTARDVFRASLFGDDLDAGLPLLGVQATGWLGDLLAGSGDGVFRPVPTPDGFGALLRPYQERGLGWLAFMDNLGVGAVLADDMGLGKTIQVLALLELERQQGGAGPTLLVCPMSLVANWQREAARFTPKLAVHVHHGAERLTGKQLQQVAGDDLVLTTYALALRDQYELAEVGWRRIVVDEAQAIKNGAAKQSRAIRALPAARRIALTGTPVENRLADLHSIMEFASPGLLGGAEAFKRHFAVPIERDGDTAAAERLRKVTGAFMLRRLKTDPQIITDLPEKVEITVVCNLTREQASLYQAVLDDMMRQVEQATGIDRRGLILATLTKLKQVCNHPAQLLKDGSRIAGRSGKVARVGEICEEVLAAGEKVLLFTQFAEFGTMLSEHLSATFSQPVPFLHGAVAKKARDAMVTSFQQEAGPGLFVLSLKAGGVGLNLTAANHVIHVDRWWNPAVEDQATDRAFRIGQRRNVQVRKLLCAGTLEERIDAVLAQKKALAEATVGTGEAWLTELSTQALRDLVALNRDAVVE